MLQAHFDSLALSLDSEYIMIDACPRFDAKSGGKVKVRSKSGKTFWRALPGFGKKKSRMEKLKSAIGKNKGKVAAGVLGAGVVAAGGAAAVNKLADEETNKQIKAGITRGAGAARGVVAQAGEAGDKVGQRVSTAGSNRKAEGMAEATMASKTKNQQGTTAGINKAQQGAVVESAGGAISKGSRAAENKARGAINRGEGRAKAAAEAVHQGAKKIKGSVTGAVDRGKEMAKEAQVGYRAGQQAVKRNERRAKSREGGPREIKIDMKRNSMMS